MAAIWVVWAEDHPGDSVHAQGRRVRRRMSLPTPRRGLPAEAQASSEIKYEQYSPSRPARRSSSTRVPAVPSPDRRPEPRRLLVSAPGEPERRREVHPMSSLTSMSQRCRRRDFERGRTGSGAARAKWGCSDSRITTSRAPAPRGTSRAQELAVPEDVGSRGEVLDSTHQFVAVALIEAASLKAVGEVDGL